MLECTDYGRFATLTSSRGIQTRLDQRPEFSMVEDRRMNSYSVRRNTPGQLMILCCAALVLLLHGAQAEGVVTLTSGGPSVATTRDVAGTARLENGCSAVLLAGGRHLLGAAHCSSPAGSLAHFPALKDQEPVRIVARAMAPGWAGRPAVHDLAIMTLEDRVSGAPGYRLATPATVDAAPWVLVAGFGAGGTFDQPTPAGGLHWGRNEYDGRMEPADVYGDRVAVFDFDDGSLSGNTLGSAPGRTSSLGLGPDEAMLSGLDSGGPTLVPVSKAGTPGWTHRWTRGAPSSTEWQLAGIHAAIDARRGSRPGGFALDTLVAPYARWIASIVGDQVLAPDR